MRNSCPNFTFYSWQTSIAQVAVTSFVGWFMEGISPDTSIQQQFLGVHLYDPRDSCYKSAIAYVFLFGLTGAVLISNRVPTFCTEVCIWVLALPIYHFSHDFRLLVTDHAAGNAMEFMKEASGLFGIDNIGVLFNLVNGTAEHHDLGSMAHGAHLPVQSLQISWWLEHVDSWSNTADGGFRVWDRCPIAAPSGVNLELEEISYPCWPHKILFPIFWIGHVIVRSVGRKTKSSST